MSGGAFRFAIQAVDGRARRGTITTAHGRFDTPAFMPVGTRAAIKGLTPAQVAQTGTQVLLANMYHLLLRPGPELIAGLGGLHRFMGWHGPILTDSGGYQVFSLADLRRVDEDGVDFRSHVDGAPVRLTPESAMAAQNLLGADIAMVLDVCPALPCAPTALTEAVRRTVAWARRCREVHRPGEQAIYGIVQGGLDIALRHSCLDALRPLDFDGYALGGLSVGEPPDEMHALVGAFAEALPADKPRYLMGVGMPRDLVRAVGAGIDQFDCVLPTRNGRKGFAFTSVGPLRLRNARHRASAEPLDPCCACYTCRNFPRAYLRHLILGEEVLGGALVALHNIAFYQSLMRQMQEAIAAGTFAAWQRGFEDGPVGRAKDTP